MATTGRLRVRPPLHAEVPSLAGASIQRFLQSDRPRPGHPLGRSIGLQGLLRLYIRPCVASSPTVYREQHLSAGASFANLNTCVKIETYLFLTLVATVGRLDVCRTISRAPHEPSLAVGLNGTSIRSTSVCGSRRLGPSQSHCACTAQHDTPASGPPASSTCKPAAEIAAR